jgi:hypothetical protein
MWYQATTLVIRVKRISSISVAAEIRNVAAEMDRWLTTPLCHGAGRQVRMETYRISSRTKLARAESELA